MMNWTIRRRVAATVAAILAVASLVGGYTHLRLREIGKATNDLRLDAIPGIRYGSQMVAFTAEDYSLTKQYLSLNEPSEKDKRLHEINANRPHLDRAVAQ